MLKQLLRSVSYEATGLPQESVDEIEAVTKAPGCYLTGLDTHSATLAAEVDGQLRRVTIWNPRHLVTIAHQE